MNGELANHPIEPRGPQGMVKQQHRRQPHTHQGSKEAQPHQGGKGVQKAPGVHLGASSAGHDFEIKKHQRVTEVYAFASLK